MKTVYVASCVENGGIHRYHMDDKGRLTWVDLTPMDRPMYMTVSEHKMYIVLRAPFADSRESGVVVYDILPDGALDNPSKVMSTRGEVACHILVDQGNVYCANYISGSVIRLPDTVVLHQGHSVHTSRQTSPHVHYVGLTPDGEYICAVDLGLDAVMLYDKELNLYSQVSVPDGHGARHIAFSQDGKYMFCANELASTVSIFSYDAGRLTPMDTVSTLADHFTGENYPAAIRMDNKTLYISNRGHNSISVLSFTEGLKLEGTVSCGGDWPRDFVLSEGKLIIANERSNQVCVRTSDAVLDTASVPAPLCITVGDGCDNGI